MVCVNLEISTHFTGLLNQASLTYGMAHQDMGDALCWIMNRPFLAADPYPSLAILRHPIGISQSDAMRNMEAPVIIHALTILTARGQPIVASRSLMELTFRQIPVADIAMFHN